MQVRASVGALVLAALYADRCGSSDSKAIFLAALGRGLASDPVSAVHAGLRDVPTTMHGRRAHSRRPAETPQLESERQIAPLDGSLLVSAEGLQRPASLKAQHLEPIVPALPDGVTRQIRNP